MATTKGLDISAAQGNNVNFAAIKAAGYDFVILRAGYGSALTYPNQYDVTFENNYAKAKAAGLKVGAYWYTYAIDPTIMVNEAKAFIKALSGKKFEMPVYMDLEEQNQIKGGITDKLVEAFCSTVEQAGYYVGVYCSTYWYTNFVSSKVRERYACWIAEWGSKCNYKGTYGIWQTGTTKVNGSGTGDIDADICYVDYTTTIKSKGLNGYPKPTSNTTTTSNTSTATTAVKSINVTVIIDGKTYTGKLTTK